MSLVIQITYSTRRILKQEKDGPTGASQRYESLVVFRVDDSEDNNDENDDDDDFDDDDDDDGDDDDDDYDDDDRE